MSERSIRRAYRRRAVAGAAAAVGAASLLATAAAEADTFTVSSLADTDELEGTLREEIEDANFQDGDDTIVFQSGLSGTITFAPGAQNIGIFSDGLDIQGPGADQITVDADGEDRIFRLSDFDAEDQVSIAGLTLTGGVADYGFEYGGALYSTTGNTNAAELTLADMVITDNYAAEDGGGVFVDFGSLTVTNSIISGNESGQEQAGGINVLNTDGDQKIEVRISDTVFSDNRAYVDGGGLRIGGADGDTLIERSTFTGNTALYDGGGIFLSGGIDAPVAIVDSTFSGNLATDHPDEPDEPDAGAIRIGGFDHPFTLQNSTLSGNSADGRGGAIRLNAAADSDVTIQNSTIAGNTAGETGGIYAFLYETSDLSLSSSIVADNSAATGGDLGYGEDNASYSFEFLTGFSLIENPAGAPLTETAAGSNLLGADPQLGPLASNGGPTQTHLPALSSPVLDHGTANGLLGEQRGLARTGDISTIPNATGGDGTDIGSVEVQVSACQGATLPERRGTDADDVLNGTEGPDLIIAGPGNDTVGGLGGDDCLRGDLGNDGLNGGAGADLLLGEAGNDRLRGKGGKDNLNGFEGKDRLIGGGGKDRLRGDAGKDRLSGGGGKDRLKGGPGKDKLKGGGGKDRFNCGGGKDKVTAQEKDKVSASCEKVVEKG